MLKKLKRIHSTLVAIATILFLAPFINNIYKISEDFNFYSSLLLALVVLFLCLYLSPIIDKEEDREERQNKNNFPPQPFTNYSGYRENSYNLSRREHVMQSIYFSTLNRSRSNITKKRHESINTDLTEDDKRFLKSFRILAEEPNNNKSAD